MERPILLQLNSSKNNNALLASQYPVIAKEYSDFKSSQTNHHKQAYQIELSIMYGSKGLFFRKPCQQVAVCNQRQNTVCESKDINMQINMRACSRVMHEQAAKYQ